MRTHAPFPVQCRPAPALRLAPACTLALAGCFSAPPLEPFTVRATISGSFLLPPAGFTRAREDVDEGFLEGDRTTLDGDLDQDGAFGYGARLDIRPFDDGELRARFDQIEEFEGEATLSRDRRFDGRTFQRGERVESSLEWRRLSASYAHRVLALRPESSLPLDLLARAGIVRSVLTAELSGEVTPEERRQLRAGAPFAGIEGRTLLLSRVLLRGSIEGGYWNHDGSRLATLEVQAGGRMPIAGPLDVELAYTFSLSDGSARFSDRELTRTRLIAHIVTLGVGVGF